MPHHAADGVAGWSRAFLTLPDRLPRVLSLLKPSSAALKNCSRPHNQHDGSDPTAPRSLSRLCQAPAFEQPVGSFGTAPPDPGSWPAPLWGSSRGHRRLLPHPFQAILRSGHQDRHVNCTWLKCQKPGLLFNIGTMRFTYGGARTV